VDILSRKDQVDTKNDNKDVQVLKEKLWTRKTMVEVTMLKRNQTMVVLWDALDMNNFYFLFLLFSDFIRILFSFSVSFLLNNEEAHDKEVT